MSDPTQGQINAWKCPRCGSRRPVGWSNEPNSGPVKALCVPCGEVSDWPPEPAMTIDYATRMRDAVAQRISGLDGSLLDLYTLLALTRGTKTVSADVHDAWAIWTAARRPEHPALVPYTALSAAEKAKDDYYATEIRYAVERVRMGL